MPIDPLNEVSTNRGDSMRETCARVLAAALMTGAIAAVVAMSALIDTPRAVERALSAPPSSLQRSVRLTALPLPRRAPATRRVLPAVTETAVHPRAVVLSRPVVRRITVARQAQTQRRQLEAVKPKQAPPAAAPAPAAASPSAPAPPATNDAQPKGHDHADHQDGQGGQNGQDNGHGQGHGHGNGNAEHEN